MSKSHETIEQFKQEKEKTVKILKQLQDFINQSTEFGASINEADKDKIKVAINEQENEKLRIALIGGFSEGKTSIIAAWLERYDESMKIDTQESSDSIEHYNCVDEELEIIDTPGLFGFKSDETGKRFKEKTREYISQAHLVLYVVDSSNPIKQSHTQELQWLFRELNLLPRTIFICNKFDENADLEDEQEYQEKYKQVRQNVIKGLKNAINLSEKEQQELYIVAISANPYGKGIEYWLSQPEEFRAISRIKSLQDATTKTIQKTGKNSIILASQHSIIRDIITQQMPKIEKEFDFYSTQTKELNKVLDNTNKDIQTFERKFNEAKNNLKEWVIKYFVDLILQTEGLSIKTLEDFIIREIGEDGINITTKIKIKFETELNLLNAQIQQSFTQFNIQIQDFSDSMTKEMLKQGVKSLKASGLINPTTIKYGRDIVVEGFKLVGLDLAKFLKFKPWGAIKAANKANAALAIAGIALEIWDSWEKAAQEEEFKKVKEYMEKEFEKQEKTLLEDLDSEEFKNNIPLLHELRKMYEEIKNNLDDIDKKRENLQKWKEEGEIIEAEFEEIKKLESK